MQNNKNQQVFDFIGVFTTTDTKTLVKEVERETLKETIAEQKKSS